MPKAPKPSVPDAIVKTRKPGPGLTKPYTPSPELAAVVGASPAQRGLGAPLTVDRRYPWVRISAERRQVSVGRSGDTASPQSGHSVGR